MVEAKQDKLAKCKSVAKLMEMSNLPQYNEAWGDHDNKELALTSAGSHVTVQLLATHNP